MTHALYSYLTDTHELACSTAEHHIRNAERFVSWCSDAQVSPTKADYTDVVSYLGSLSIARQTKQLHLASIRYFFDWQVTQALRTGNPARTVVLRAKTRRLPHALLSEDQLWQMYREAPTSTSEERRDREIVGLIALQGLQPGEVKRLTVEMVHLDQAYLQVPSCRRSVPRRMALYAEQVVPLLRYLETDRPLLLPRKQVSINSFVVGTSRYGTASKQNIFFYLCNRLKRQYPFFERLEQLRASRIAYWVQAHGLRKAQHLAGHRFVSSTERYQRATLDALKRAVETHHPLGHGVQVPLG